MIKVQRTSSRGVMHLWNKHCYIGAIVQGVITIMPHWKTQAKKRIVPNLPRGLRKLKVVFAVPFHDGLPDPPPPPQALTLPQDPLAEEIPEDIAQAMAEASEADDTNDEQ